MYRLSINKKSQELELLQDIEVDERVENNLDKRDIILTRAEANRSLLFKFWFQIVMLLIVHGLIFWHLPMKANNILQTNYYCTYDDPETGEKCNEVFMNYYLTIFYFLFVLYFMISALQVRFGLPEIRKGSIVREDTSPISKGIVQGYLATPFIFELKIISDWTFTKTALDLFQWIKFETIHLDLYIAKCTNKGYLEHKLGDPISKGMKFLLGCCGIFVLVLIIAGPLLLFSSFNPLAKDNFVNGAKIRVEIFANITRDETLSK
jgi:hypothetical protein